MRKLIWETDAQRIPDCALKFCNQRYSHFHSNKCVIICILSGPYEDFSRIFFVTDGQKWRKMNSHGYKRSWGLQAQRERAQEVPFTGSPIYFLSLEDTTSFLSFPYPLNSTARKSTSHLGRNTGHKIIGSPFGHMTPPFQDCPKARWSTPHLSF